MIKLKKYTNDIKQLCYQYKVERLYALDSALTTRFDQNHNISFIVEFEPFDIAQYADNYYNLKFSLENIFRRPIILLEDKAIKNPYFRQVIDNQRQLVYLNPIT